MRRFAALGFIAAAAVCSLARLIATESGSDDLEAQIRALRSQGRYADAVAVAESLFALRAGASDSLGAGNARRLAATLSFAAALTAEEQRRLAGADSSTEQIETLFRRGDYAGAAVVAQERLKIQSEILGGEHEEVAASLGDLALLRGRVGDLTSAESLFTRALAIEVALLGNDHPKVAQTLNNQAVLHWNQGRSREAEEEWRRSLAIRRRHLAADDPALASTIQNLAQVHEDQGDVDGAASLMLEALALKENAFGQEDPRYAQTLGVFAMLLDRMGESARAEVLYRKALATLHAAYGEDHPDVARARERLGMHLEEQGDHEAAKELVANALAVQRRFLGSDHPDVAGTLTALASILQDCGEEQDAERLHREAVGILESRFGEDHPRTIRSLASLGLLEDRVGAHARAESIFTIVYDAVCRKYPADHAERARAALNLAISLRKQGEYVRAAPLMEEAIAIRRGAFGQDHAALASVLRHAGHLQLLAGDLELAHASLAEATQIFENARLRTKPGLARVTFAESPYTLLASVELLRGHSDEAWPAVERNRGRGLADMLAAADRRTLSSEERQAELDLAREVGDLERALAAIQERASRDSAALGTSGATLEAAQGALLEAEARWTEFEREIAQRNPVGAGQAFGLERVQKVLAPGTAVIGWLDVAIERDSVLAWAYVIRDKGPVRWMRVDALGSPVQRPDWFLALESALRDAASDPRTVRDGARRLWEARFAPLEPELESIDALVVVPTGPTASIPVECWRDAQGCYLGERLSISYSPSCTVFAWLSEHAHARRSWDDALLVGDPPFSEEDLVDMRTAGSVATARLGRPSDLLLRGAESESRGVPSLPRLFGSRNEIAAIDSVLGSATVLLGLSASEQEFVRRAGSGDLARYDVLHFATHALIDHRRPERSALVLSRVGLPDALQAASSGERIFDGLITAKEILREWRLDADLVALSACESGLGKELGGEGTVGFAHAFFQAGARSVLVSLWRVDDRATALFMRRFYENCSGARRDRSAGAPQEPMSKAEALREARSWLRDYRTGSGRTPYAHPWYWSPFVLIGDRR